MACQRTAVTSGSSPRCPAAVSILSVVAAGRDQFGVDLDEVGTGEIGALDCAELVAVTGDRLEQECPDVRLAGVFGGGVDR